MQWNLTRLLEAGSTDVMSFRPHDAFGFCNWMDFTVVPFYCACATTRRYVGPGPGYSVCACVRLHACMRAHSGIESRIQGETGRERSEKEGERRAREPAAATHGDPAAQPARLARRYLLIFIAPRNVYGTHKSPHSHGVSNLHIPLAVVSAPWLPPCYPIATPRTMGRDALLRVQLDSAS